MRNNSQIFKIVQSLWDHKISYAYSKVKPTVTFYFWSAFELFHQFLQLEEPYPFDAYRPSFMFDYFLITNMPATVFYHGTIFSVKVRLYDTEKV